MSRTSVTIPTRDGRAPASVFTPSTDAGPWPAVLFYMDARGPRPALFEVGERLASAGYYVLLPDLFYRAGSYDPPSPKLFSDPEARKSWQTTYMATASHANIRSDTEAFLAFLAAQRALISPRIGTVGYCMGGGLALAAAANYPDRVVAAASYHGGGLATDAFDSPHLLADHIKARVYVAVPSRTLRSMTLRKLVSSQPSNVRAWRTPSKHTRVHATAGCPRIRPFTIPKLPSATFAH